jgi:hypothetical protein
MTGPRRRFEVVAPDWGVTHLTSDAVVAFVDEELDPVAHRRATEHVADCPYCAADVTVQQQAQSVLQSAHGPQLSSSLLDALRTIPQDAELPPSPPGLAVGPDGRIVQALREPAVPPQRRLGPRIVLGGLAVGALALTVTFLPADTVRGVFGGPVLDPGAQVARLQAPVQPTATPLGLAEPAPQAGDLSATEVVVQSPPPQPGPDGMLRGLDVLPAAFPRGP